MRRSSRLFLVVATTFLGFFQPGHPFVFQRQLLCPKLELSRPTEKDLGNLQLDGTTIDGDSDYGRGGSSHEPCEGNCSDQFQPSTAGRRECLAKMALVATVPALWAFPEIAAASSSVKKNPNSSGNSSVKARDRPVAFELSAAVQKLFDLDEPNRLVPGKDYVIDVQGRKKNTKTNNENRNETNDSNIDNDAALDPLFRYVDRAFFEERPTYKAFVALLDNYQPNVCLEEDNTRDDTEEAYAFLRACMATPVLKFCYSYCKSKQQLLLLLLLAEQEREHQEASSAEETTTSKYIFPKQHSFDTEEDFVQLLYKIWFQLYSRSEGCDNDNNNNNNNEASSDENGSRKPKKVYGSSGFEHVFVGEIRKSKVIGFHNWIQLYRQEQAGNLDYRGTIRGGDAGNDKSTRTPRVLTYNVRWKGAEKPVGSSLLGVTPEFELALYTMVFLVGNKNDNILLLDLDDDNRDFDRDADRFLTKLDVKCFRTKGRVGSCYVESLAS